MLRLEDGFQGPDCMLQPQQPAVQTEVAVLCLSQDLACVVLQVGGPGPGGVPQCLFRLLQKVCIKPCLLYTSDAADE